MREILTLLLLEWAYRKRRPRGLSRCAFAKEQRKIANWGCYATVGEYLIERYDMHQMGDA